MKLLDNIINDLSLSIEDIFSKYQDELDIKSGDIEPLQHLELICLTEKLGDLILDILENQQI